MLGIFAYLGICLVVASVVTLLWVLWRPIRERDEMRSWRVLLFLFVCTSLAPYAWGEVLTRMYGKAMNGAVEQVIDELKINDGLRFYRVLTCWHEKARVIAVGQERANWGGTERPVIAISMVKTSKGWTADSYTIVNSMERNKDSVTLPPYW